jgi:hypothetical protein
VQDLATSNDRFTYRVFNFPLENLPLPCFFLATCPFFSSSLQCAPYVPLIAPASVQITLSSLVGKKLGRILGVCEQVFVGMLAFILFILG